MYQTIVLGLGFLLLIGGGYLIKHVDHQGVLGSSLSITQGNVVTPVAAESFAGTYLCDTTSGCQNPRILTLSSNGEAIMNASYENGAEVVDETGAWSVSPEGVFSITLTGNNQGQYPASRIFLVRYASKSTLSGITFDAKLYEDLKNPVFHSTGSQPE